MNKRQRTQTITTLYSNVSKLTPKHRWYREQLRRYLFEAVLSDGRRDSTAQLLTTRSSLLEASLVLKEDAIVAGIEEVLWLCTTLGIDATTTVKDGRSYKTGKRLLTVSGSARAVLRAERTLVNTVQRMSGVATASRIMVETVERRVVIAATRKTLWGALDKKAAAMGKAVTHRLHLRDGIMFKDSHLALLDEFADIAAVKIPKRKFTEIEVSDMEQLRSVLEKEVPVDAIMLDNFTAAECKKAIALAKKLKQHQYYIFEASGGITLDNCKAYSKTGVDVISSGAITHSAPAIDVSLVINNVQQ